MQIKLFILVLFIGCMSCQHNTEKTELKVLQFNIWQEGTVVENGFPAIVDNILSLDPDMITFSEVRNYNDEDFIERLKQALKQKGLEYYGKSSISTGILSKYPISKQEVIYPLQNDRGSVTKAEITVNDKTVILYSAHLDYTHYACFLPRGYDGITWEKLDTIVTDLHIIQTMNQNSLRDEAVNEIIKDAKKEAEKDRIIIVGGDFNEPSHLDWVESTKDSFDHNGVIYAWDCSTLLYENGFRDAYREIYPDPSSHPGFTFPSNNEHMEVQKLTWAPDADEQERIDFIYFKPNKKLYLKDISIVGPSGSIIRNERVKNESNDPLILPHGIWPTDHKAVMATFILK